MAPVWCSPRRTSQRGQRGTCVATGAGSRPGRRATGVVRRAATDRTRELSAQTIWRVTRRRLLVVRESAETRSSGVFLRHLGVRRLGLRRLTDLTCDRFTNTIVSICTRRSVKEARRRFTASAWPGNNRRIRMAVCSKRLRHQFAKNGDAARRLVMKIDVEGAEWDTFVHTPDDVLDRIDQLAVEFHGVDRQRYVDVVKNLKRLFYIANLHFNNYSCKSGIPPFPAWAYEVLFVNKRLGVPDRSGKRLILHPANAPNNPSLADCQGSDPSTGSSHGVGSDAISYIFLTAVFSLRPQNPYNLGCFVSGFFGLWAGIAIAPPQTGGSDAERTDSTRGVALPGRRSRPASFRDLRGAHTLQLGRPQARRHLRSPGRARQPAHSLLCRGAADCAAVEEVHFSGGYASSA